MLGKILVPICFGMTSLGSVSPVIYAAGTASHWKDLWRVTFTHGTRFARCVQHNYDIELWIGRDSSSPSDVKIVGDGFGPNGKVDVLEWTIEGQHSGGGNIKLKAPARSGDLSQTVECQESVVKNLNTYSVSSLKVKDLKLVVKDESKCAKFTMSRLCDWELQQIGGGSNVNLTNNGTKIWFKAI